MHLNYRILLVFLTSCFFYHKTYSQILVQSFPVAGDTVVFSVHQTPMQPVYFSTFDQTGLNHTWDFSNWQIGGYDTLVFDVPTSNTFADTFPDAELAVLSSLQTQSEFFPFIKYMKLEGNEVQIVGNVVNVQSNAFLAQIPESTETLFSFPINTGNNFKDTTLFITKVLGSELGLPVDSVMQKSTVYRSDTVDGSGQLLLNGYSLNNLYRNKITDHKIDSMFTYTQGLGWELLEVKVRDFVNVFWLNSDDFFAAWMEVRSDSVTNIKIKKYNPSVRLELVNFPNEGIENVVLSEFEVRAYNINDNSLATDFNDVVSIVGNTPPFSSQNSIGGIAQATSGVATFSNLYFTAPGNFEVIAVSDTVEASPSENITIHPGPDSLAIINLLSTPEGELLSPVEVHVFNSLGVHDLLYVGNVNIGKLSGNGKIGGTLTKPVINGISTFDDISFNHNGIYNIISWLPGFDSAVVDSEYVNISPNPDLQWVSDNTDTLSEYVDRATFFVWTGGVDGFLSGTSRLWYDEVAQHFTFSSRGRLTKVVFYIALWQQVNNNILNDTYKLKIYDAGVLPQNQPPFNAGVIQDSLPISLLGEQEFSASIFQPTDFFVRTPTVVTFDTPVEVYSDFIVALEVNSATTDDTVVIWTSIIGDGMLERRNMRHTINYNTPLMVEGWVHDLDFRPTYDVDNMIMPVIEVDTMDILTSLQDQDIPRVNIYPNPSTGNIFINSNELIQQVKITDLSGRVIFIYTTVNENKDVILNLHDLSSGLYSAEISLSNGNSVKEKLVILNP
jgi:hypothetical protein